MTALTLGTAGHVDHGKTTLVAALTGKDTDRLAEEKRRGISIELGFAELDLGDHRLSIIDVPGHERFLRTMVAGASGVDGYLLVVAADDGAMPQTIEHLLVLRALGVSTGIVALSKCDLVGRAAREETRLEVAALVPEAPVVDVSSRTGEGFSELREAIRVVSASLGRPRDVDRPPVLHVDRVFSVAGYGTVVTGTLLSGEIHRGELVTLLPTGHEARVRSIQVHDRPLSSVAAHQRVALNLGGVRRDQVSRGDAVTVSGGDLVTTYRLDVRLIVGVEAILGQRRVQVHLGTRDASARVVNLGGGTVQLRLEQALLARCDDRVVVRSIAPPDTLGGGVILRSSPPRHGPNWEPLPDPPRVPVVDRPKAPARTNPLAHRILVELRDDGPRPRTPAVLAVAVGNTPREVERALAALVADGEAVRVRRDLVYTATEYSRLRGEILGLVATNGSVTIAEVRDHLGLSRKYAHALLEHLGAKRALRRVGDRHFA